MEIGSTSWCDRVDGGAKQLGVALTPGMIDRLAGHASALLQWNRRFNLTAITDPEEVAVKHVIDALAPVPLIPVGAKLIDIGAGGGFPGIPLKIALPAIDVTLIDASRKKVSFMQHAIRQVALSGIRARHVRAEAMAGEPGAVGAFDVVICRALSDLGRFFELAAPLAAPDGMILALKGAVGPEEMARAETAAHGLSKAFRRPLAVTVETYALPIYGARRTLVRLGRQDKAGAESR
jgi:16S rRNA (guanine527-N7)-methyltransferase